MCPHAHNADSCPTWFCRYDALTAKHGSVIRSVSGYRYGQAWSANRFADGTVIFTRDRVTVLPSSVPAEVQVWTEVA